MRYIIAPQNLKADDQIVSGTDAPVKVGNCMPLSVMPVGTTIHCLEMVPNKGAQIARSAGCYAQLIARAG